MNLFLPQWSNCFIEQQRKKVKKTMPMECSNGAGQNATEMVMLNQKLTYDIASQLQLDNQRNARAWAALELTNAQDNAFFKNLAVAGLLQLTQTGATEDQNLTKPVPNAVIDDTTAAAGGAISASVADAALGNVTAQLATLTTQVVGLAALIAQYVTNAGNAASPKG
jgi:hypothetical protein